MKLLTIRSLLLAFGLFATAHLSAADRWSTDETAIRMGVQSWFSLWDNPALKLEAQSVKNLYAITPSTPRPATGQPGQRIPVDQATVEISGNRGVSTFRLPSPEATLVTLTWERRDGLWRIVQESVAGSDSAAERVAVSHISRK